MSIKLRVSPGALLTVALVVVLLGFQGGWPVAEANTSSDQHWDEWRPLSQGFVARRRMPPNADKPVEQRRLAGTQKRYREQVVEQSAAGGGLTRARALRAEEAVANRLGGSLRIPAWFPTSRRTPASSVWLNTGEPGLYTLKIEELAENTGINAHLIRWFARTGRFTLLNAEQPVSWHFDSKTDTMWFAGEKYETFYSDINAYQLKSRATPDRNRMKVKEVRTRGKGSRTPFRDTIRFEEEPDMFFRTEAVPDSPDADYWFWDYLYGAWRDRLELPLDVPHPNASGVAEIRIQLQGASNLLPGNDHHVYAELNGVQVGASAIWDGFEAAEIRAEFDQALLSPDGNNTLVLRNVYDTDTTPLQFLNHIEVSYLRLPTADNGKLWIKQASGGVQSVAGFSSRNIVVIESPVRDAVLRSGARVYRSGDGWAVSFDTNEGDDYLVVERSGFVAPLVEAGDASDLRSARNGADYLILAPRDFPETAEALARHRASTFSQVRIAWLDEIYKEFGSGREDPFAISRFMDTVVRDWHTTPSMVVLLGKGSVDHKNRMGYSDSFLPVVMTSNPWQRAASDTRLTGFDDGNPPFALGRLPITSDDEGVGYVRKLEEHESGAPRSALEALVTADNPDSAGDFHADSELTAERLTTLGFDEVAKLYHSTHAVRDGLNDAQTWQNASYVAYTGHGTATQIGNYTAAEKFLTAANADELSNSLYPVFTALTCSAGDDTRPGTRSLAGALVLNPSGGAIASFVPTGLSLNSDANSLGLAFVDSLFGGGGNTVGGAVRDAKLATTGEVRGFMSPMYSVVGDPAARVR